MQDLLKELSILTDGDLKDDTKQHLLEEISDKLGSRIATDFGVKEHEVAILLVSARRNILKFEYPKALRNSGTIPLKGRVSSKDAIALKTLANRRGEAINAVQTVKHLAVFEMVKHTKESPLPIQKMMSAPMLSGADAVGVIQVSRKGENPARAGADFSDGDLKKLESLASSVAGFYAKLLPSNY